MIDETTCETFYKLTRTMRSRGNGGACNINDPNSRLMGFVVIVFDPIEFIELATDVSSIFFCFLSFILLEIIERNFLFFASVFLKCKIMICCILSVGLIALYHVIQYSHYCHISKLEWYYYIYSVLCHIKITKLSNCLTEITYKNSRSGRSHLHSPSSPFVVYANKSLFELFAAIF